MCLVAVVKPIRRPIEIRPWSLHREDTGGSGAAERLAGARIAYLARDEAEMVELYARHRLLGEEALREKIRTIREVTAFNVTDALTREQRATWWTWDLRLDEEGVKAPVRRSRAGTAE